MSWVLNFLCKSCGRTASTVMDAMRIKRKYVLCQHCGGKYEL